MLAPFRGWASLRWSIAGIALSGVALAISLAIAQAPVGYLPGRVVPLESQPASERPVRPAARPPREPVRRDIAAVDESPSLLAMTR